MRSLKIIVSLLAIYLSICCQNNDNSSTSNKINGKWELVTISSFLIEANQTFTPGIITWTFNDNNTVTVVNNSGITDFNLPTGIYNYTIGQNSADNGAPCSEYLTIDGGQFGCIAIENGQLNLASSNPDGLNYTLLSN